MRDSCNHTPSRSLWFKIFLYIFSQLYIKYLVCGLRCYILSIYGLTTKSFSQALRGKNQQMFCDLDLLWCIYHTLVFFFISRKKSKKDLDSNLLNHWNYMIKNSPCYVNIDCIKKCKTINKQPSLTFNIHEKIKRLYCTLNMEFCKAVL